jgi:hypothetical protein
MKFLLCASGKFARPNHITYSLDDEEVFLIFFSTPSLTTTIDPSWTYESEFINLTTMAFDEIENSARREKQKKIPRRANT